MICERCRNNIADNTVVCPICGNLTSRAYQPPSQQSGQYAGGPVGGPPPYQQGYGQPDYTSYPPQSPNQQGYGQPDYTSYPPQPPNMQRQGPWVGNVGPQYSAAPPNVTVVNNVYMGNKNNGALIAEIILSLFGIYGVGWLMAGETTAGVILLICSIVLYWPIVIVLSIVTLGIGLLCLSPFIIGAIILNALLLNSNLKRKAQVFIMQPPPMQMPPRY